MKRTWVLLLVAAIVGTCLGQAARAADADTAKVMADLAAKGHNSLAVVTFSAEDDLVKATIPGMAICVGAEGDKGILITTSLDVTNSVILPNSIKSVQVLVPGGDKPLKAVYKGTDPETGITFIEVTDPFKWQPIRFAEKADLPVGKTVYSVGLMEPGLGLEPYVGTASVSARVRVPGPLVYVAGGSLTNIGSPVFTADGVAVGIVTQLQLPNVVQITSGGGQPANVFMSSQRENSCFLPVDDFAQTLKNPPTVGKRRTWIGVLSWQPHRQDIVPLDVPAVRAGKVIPGSPADKAGLKENATITALNGKPLEKFATDAMTCENFARTLSRIPAGSTVKLSVMEASGAKTIDVAVESLPAMPRDAARKHIQPLGMVIREKVPMDEYLDQTATAKEKGLYVVLVAPEGPAQKAGLKGEPESTLILQVNNKPVTTIAEFSAIVDAELAKDPKKGVSMLVQKNAQREPVTLAPVAK